MLHARSQSRALRLVAGSKRAVQRSHVHELIVTEDMRAAPGRKVDRVAYVAFFEVLRPGVLSVGDAVRMGRRRLGTLAGFDLTHHPNHLNIVIAGPGRAKTGSELGIGLGGTVVIGASRSQGRR